MSVSEFGPLLSRRSMLVLSAILGAGGFFVRCGLRESPIGEVQTGEFPLPELVPTPPMGRMEQLLKRERELIAFARAEMKDTFPDLILPDLGQHVADAIPVSFVPLQSFMDAKWKGSLYRPKSKTQSAAFFMEPREILVPRNSDVYEQVVSNDTLWNRQPETPFRIMSYLIGIELAHAAGSKEQGSFMDKFVKNVKNLYGWTISNPYALSFDITTPRGVTTSASIFEETLVHGAMSAICGGKVPQISADLVPDDLKNLMFKLYASLSGSPDSFDPKQVYSEALQAKCHGGIEVLWEGIKGKYECQGMNSETSELVTSFLLARVGYIGTYALTQYLLWQDMIARNIQELEIKSTEGSGAPTVLSLANVQKEYVNSLSETQKFIGMAVDGVFPVELKISENNSDHR